jgi:protein-tyrosine-phosphatase
LKKVLFICVENACRSQIAEALFNKYAMSKTVAASAGTRPAKQVNPKTVEVMKEIGIDISKQKPKLLTPEMTKEVDRIVAMGCGADFCPAPYVKAEDWKIEDPSGKSLEKFREVRDEIRRKVEKLIKEIS